MHSANLSVVCGDKTLWYLRTIYDVSTTVSSNIPPIWSQRLITEQLPVNQRPKSKKNDATSNHYLVTHPVHRATDMLVAVAAVGKGSAEYCIRTTTTVTINW